MQVITDLMMRALGTSDVQDLRFFCFSKFYILL